MTEIDIYVWIKKVVRSCKDFFQLLNCKNLIERYRIMYGHNVYYKRLIYQYDQMWIFDKKTW